MANGPQLSAALLFVFAFLLLVEGISRLLENGQSTSYSGTYNIFPGGVLVASAVTEVFVAIVLMVAAAMVCLLGLHSKLAFRVLFWFAHLLFFNFVVYIIALPAFNEARNGPLYPTSTASRSGFLTAAGVLIGISYCWSLQGGAFVLLWNLAMTSDDTESVTFEAGEHVKRISMYGGNLAFAGLWTLISSAVIRGDVGEGFQALPVWLVQPVSNIIPGLFLFTGVLGLLSGVGSIVVGVFFLKNRLVLLLACALLGLDWLWQLFAMVLYSYTWYAPLSPALAGRCFMVLALVTGIHLVPLFLLGACVRHLAAEKA